MPSKCWEVKLSRPIYSLPDYDWYDVFQLILNFSKEISAKNVTYALFYQMLADLSWPDFSPHLKMNF